MHLVWILRIAIGAVLGGVIGYERDRHGKRAGLRTHLLVGMASATFMVVSAHFAKFQGYSELQLAGVDGSRIASCVVMGIGFLAGGAILRTGLTIQGLTTAAGLWLVTAIGLAAGSGMYPVAVVATALGMVALTVMRRLEAHDNHHPERRVSIVISDGQDQVERLGEVLKEVGGVVFDLEYDKRIGQETRVVMRFCVRLPAEVTLERLTERLETLSGVRRIRIEQMR